MKIYNAKPLSEVQANIEIRTPEELRAEIDALNHQISEAMTKLKESEERTEKAEIKLATATIELYEKITSIQNTIDELKKPNK